MRLSTAPHPTPPAWHAAADDLRLPPGEAHIWWAGLKMEGPDLSACWDLLSPQETRVASSRHFVKDLREFVIKAVGTGLLYSPNQVNVLPETKEPSMVGLIAQTGVKADPLAHFFHRISTQESWR